MAASPAPRLTRVLLADDLADASAARRLVRAVCHEVGRPDLADPACLVASELVANAIVHAPGRCELRVHVGPAAVRIEVFDAGGGTPKARAAALDDEAGRGLAIVGSLSCAWGVEQARGEGKAVWAELA
jgi:anti-sigma regulatory factor (Ser/Thr protein kinase)